MARPIRGLNRRRQVSVRLPEELLTALRNYAEDNGFSTTSVIEDFLTAALREAHYDLAQREAALEMHNPDNILA